MRETPNSGWEDMGGDGSGFKSEDLRTWAPAFSGVGIMPEDMCVCLCVG